jgi:flagellar FliL protein
VIEAMNSKIKIVAALLAVAVFMAAAGAAAAWYGLRARAPGVAGAAPAASAPPAQAAAASQAAAVAAVVVDTGPQKYVTLEKVIVMLRREPGETVTHYLAADLVFRTPEDKERIARDHLPMLRSIAVKTLSTLSVDKAGTMSIDQYATEINRAFSESYAREHREKPFSEAMIGKLIIE